MDLAGIFPADMRKVRHLIYDCNRSKDTERVNLGCPIPSPEHQITLYSL